MGDMYGPLPLPAPQPGPDEAIGDPALDIILPFLKALLNYHGARAWQAVSSYQNGGDLLVVSTFTFDPGEDGGKTFNTGDLPALFLWREEVGSSEWIAHDYWVRSSKLILLWVPPPAPQADRARWQSIINLIASALDGILDPHARVPGYIFAGDTDPIAQYQGSLLYRFLPFIWEFDVGKTKRQPVKITMVDGSATETYWATRTEIIIRERADTDDPAVHAFPLQGITVTGIENDALQIVPDVVLNNDVRSIEPTSGSKVGGNVVTILGVGFDDDPVVTFGNEESENVVVSSNAIIRALVPESSSVGSVVVTVTNRNGDASTTSYTYT